MGNSLKNTPFVPGHDIGAATRWKPGQSGNPAGRPKNAGLSILEHLNNLAASTLPEAKRIVRKKDEHPLALVAAARWFIAAVKGDRHITHAESMRALALLIEHTHGRATQKLALVDEREHDVLQLENEIRAAMGQPLLHLVDGEYREVIDVEADPASPTAASEEIT